MYLYQVRNDQRPPSAGQGGLVSAVAGHIYTATTLRVTIISDDSSPSPYAMDQISACLLRGPGNKV